MQLAVGSMQLAVGSMQLAVGSSKIPHDTRDDNASFRTNVRNLTKKQLAEFKNIGLMVIIRR